MLIPDTSTWTRVTFGDAVESITERVDNPSEAGVERYVGLEHLDPGMMTVRRWGVPEQVESQKLRFYAGDVIFGRRRAYQKKVAVADFDGICSAHALVLRSRPEIVHPEFLPVLLSSDYFLDRAIAISVGSLSPTVNWRDLKIQEFRIPPLDDQRRIANLLWSVERYRLASLDVAKELERTRAAWLHSLFSQAKDDKQMADLDTLVDSRHPICYGVLKPGPEFENGRFIVDVKDYPSGEIELNLVRRCDPRIESAFRRSRLKSGDVLLSIRGTIGRAAVVPAQLDGHNISRDSARISGDPTKIMPEFLQLVLESPDVQGEIRRTTTGLAVKGINVSRIRSLQVPNWTLANQREAVSKVRRVERSLGAVKTNVDALLKLRQTILSTFAEDEL